MHFTGRDTAVMAISVSSGDIVIGAVAIMAASGRQERFVQLGR